MDSLKKRAGWSVGMSVMIGQKEKVHHFDSGGLQPPFFMVK
jgi:hypothetical protein